jgi:CRISPR/Cas system CSM-associated protein Csm2 small subunit
LNTLRNNIVSILLIVGVLAVTGLNHFSTQKNCQLYLEGTKAADEEFERNLMVAQYQTMQAMTNEQITKLATVAQSEAERASRIESEFNDLATKYVQLNRVLNQAGIEIYGLHGLLNAAGEHIKECHRLLKDAGVDPPAFEELPTFPQAPMFETPESAPPCKQDKSA